LNKIYMIYPLTRIKIILLASFLILLFLSGCERGYFGSSVPIKKLLENPRDYDNRTVYIEGEVTEVFSLLVVKYFTLKDNTGEIIVVTERILPKKGEKVKVKGRMAEAFSIGDKTLRVFKEERG
jgi:hypothetical protein